MTETVRRPTLRRRTLVRELFAVGWPALGGWRPVGGVHPAQCEVPAAASHAVPEAVAQSRAGLAGLHFGAFELPVAPDGPFFKRRGPLRSQGQQLLIFSCCWLVVVRRRVESLIFSLLFVPLIPPTPFLVFNIHTLITSIAATAASVRRASVFAAAPVTLRCSPATRHSPSARL